jgi:hypothetical protein
VSLTGERTPRTPRWRVGRKQLALTVQNGTLEVAEELEEHVLLLGGQLVEADTLAAAVDLGALQTLVHVGHEPIFGADEVLAVVLLVAAPEGPPGPLLLLGHVLFLADAAHGGDGFPAAIAVGVDVAHEAGVLVELFALGVDLLLLVHVAIFEVEFDVGPGGTGVGRVGILGRGDVRSVWICRHDGRGASERPRREAATSVGEARNPRPREKNYAAPELGALGLGR